MTRLLSILLLWAVAADASLVATNVNQSGDATHWSVSQLNTPSNWGAGAAQVGPGTTVTLSGIISSPITILSNGAPGNPVTILFATGAKLSTGAWGGQHYCAIAATNVTDIVINGGVNGEINATNCGDAPLTDGSGVNGIWLADSSRITIENLLIDDLYVRTAYTNNTTAQGTGITYGSQSGAAYGGLLVFNCVFHDMEFGVQCGAGTNTTNQAFVNCTCWNVNMFGSCGVVSSGRFANGVTVSGCACSNWANWDDTINDNFHHNFFYCYGQSGGSISNINYIGNNCGPGFSTYNTSGFFVSGQCYAVTVASNIFFMFDESGNPISISDGYVTAGIATGGTATPIAIVANNTFICASTLGAVQGIGILVSGSLAGTPYPVYSITNNLFYGVSLAIWNNYYTSTGPFWCDYNLYWNCPLNTQPSATAFSISSGNSPAYLNWSVSYSGSYYWTGPNHLQDQHGVTNNPQLNAATGALGAGSAALNAGLNMGYGTNIGAWQASYTPPAPAALTIYAR